MALLIFLQSPSEDDPQPSTSTERYSPPKLPSLTADSLNGIYAQGPSNTVADAPKRLLSYDENNFTLDGRPIRLVSGSVHYFRMVPSAWRPVLMRARAMGLNAISTYVPWNLHETAPSHFRFSGMLDLRAFLEIAHELGLLVLLRPGPYICSEWENGGLPPFLLADENMALRSSYNAYLDAVRNYIDTVANQISPYIGKPVMAIQIENEYGIYGSDKDYLHFLLDSWQENDMHRDNVMFFTSENGGPDVVLNGSQFDSAEVLKTANLKDHARERIGMLREIQPKAPAMISEFWTGWFDHWGKPHHARDGLEIVQQIGDVLNKFHASVNMYMFFGGTNFGFMNGANIDRTGKYWSVVTSYDYDGMLNEYGGVRKGKYVPMQKMLREFWDSLGEKDMVEAIGGEVPKAPSFSSYSRNVMLEESIALYDVLDVVTDKKAMSTYPMSIEELGGDYGLIMYRHDLKEETSESVALRISKVRDVGHVVVDGKVVGRAERNDEHGGADPKKITIQKGARNLDIIVENRGRVTVGPYIHDRKGILGNVTLGGKTVEGFQCLSMSFVEDHELLRDNFGRKTITMVRKMMSGRDRHNRLGNESSAPVFFRGQLYIGGEYARYKQELPGTHCKIYGQGMLWVNGFNLGRFNTEVDGPQRTLYVPGEILREGVNEFMVLHMRMDLVQVGKVELLDTTDIGE